MGNVAKKKKNEQPVEPEQEQEQEQRELPKLPKERNPLLTVLTILLVLTGVGELALWGYFGFASVQANRALRRYEAERQAAAEERAAQGIVYSSAYGPSLKVENGQVTWRLEDEDILPAAGGTAADTAASQGGGEQAGTASPRLQIPKIPYALAEQDSQLSAQGDVSLGDGTRTPT